MSAGPFNGADTSQEVFDRRWAAEVEDMRKAHMAGCSGAVTLRSDPFCRCCATPPLPISAFPCSVPAKEKVEKHKGIKMQLAALHRGFEKQRKAMLGEKFKNKAHMIRSALRMQGNASNVKATSDDEFR